MKDVDQLKKVGGNKNDQWSEEPGLTRKMGRLRFNRENKRCEKKQ